MNSDKALKLQIEKIRERLTKRLHDLDDEMNDHIRRVLYRRLVLPLAILLCAIIAIGIHIGFVGRALIIPGCILLMTIGVLVCTFYKRRAEAVLNKELDDKKQIYISSLQDLDLTLMIANDAASAKKNFLSGVSHDFRTPINAILGFASMISKESNDKVARNYAKDIAAAGNTLLAYVNDVMDTTGLEEGTLEIINMDYDFCSLIYDVYGMYIALASEKGLKLTVRTDEDIPCMLHGDGIRIKQCILKLLNNAVKYTEEGSVTVEFGYAKLSEEKILLTVSVSDTGPGIKNEDLDRILCPFEKIDQERHVKNEGAGLGISITHGLLKLMDSELRVDSKYGIGSTFKFSVVQKVLDWTPVGNIPEHFVREQPEAEASGENDDFIAPNAKILVVDDSPVNLMIAEGLLKDTKIQLTKADSGSNALKECSTTKFDMILLDHMMPEMDGVETLHHIKKDGDSLNRTTPVAALTANSVEGAKELYEKEGFDCYLTKPIVIEKLKQEIIRFISPKLVMYGPFEEGSEKETMPVVEENTQENAFLCKMKEIPGIYIEKGLEYSGSCELYEKVAAEFANTGLSRANTIEELYEAEDIKNYTIQVHALKSSARIIGAIPLSMLAAALEEAGNEENLLKIKNATGELLSLYRELVAKLETVFCDDSEKPEIDEASIKDAVCSLKEVVEAFDFDSVDSIMDELKKYKMPENYKERYAKLKTLVAEVARDDILLLLETF